MTNKIKGFIERGIKCQNLDFLHQNKEKNTHEYFFLIMNIYYEIGVYVWIDEKNFNQCVKLGYFKDVSGQSNFIFSNYGIFEWQSA